MVTCCHFVVDEILTAVSGVLLTSLPPRRAAFLIGFLTSLQAYPWFATLPGSTQQLEHTVHAPDYLNYHGRGRDWGGTYAENIKQLNLRLRRLVHQGMADVIDPSRCLIMLIFFYFFLCILSHTVAVTSHICFKIFYQNCCF